MQRCKCQIFVPRLWPYHDVCLIYVPDVFVIFPSYIRRTIISLDDRILNERYSYPHVNDNLLRLFERILCRSREIYFYLVRYLK